MSGLFRDTSLYDFVYLFMYVHRDRQTDRQTDTHTHTVTHTYTYTYILTYMHTYIHALISIHVSTYIWLRMYACNIEGGRGPIRQDCSLDKQRIKYASSGKMSIYPSNI